ncbi:hypothetical protein [Nitrolancea hollandica]|uniref:Uncharacterized protein n=1 Tax=Nitrolancea hollandica Lb TaxID=1129897 RepID=I4EG17_9BACT|nr:hypothetical protein [Nitrolancea hollandica]CCF83629.1 hypothetical protein NITHO_2520004 [Nitrolancea hollandica Lb]
MTHSYWREVSQRVITEVIATYPEWEHGNEAQRWMLLDRIDLAYPFGQRENHPYRIWLDERRAVMVRLGLREPEPTAGAIDREALKAAGQMELL